MIGSSKTLTCLMDILSRRITVRWPKYKIPGYSAVEFSLVENIIFLRYVELRSQLFRLISIMKVRESGHDPAIREFRITDGGIDVAATFDSAEAILTGIAHPSALSTLPTSRRPRRGQG